MKPPSANIASALVEMARQQPESLAIAAPRGGAPRGPEHDLCWTYAELNRASDVLARGLEAKGIGRGVRTALMVTPSLELFALTFALFKVGAVPVLVDPGIGLKNLKVCLAEAEPEAFIGVTRAHVARVLFGWASQTLKTLVTVGPRLFWGGHSQASIEAAGAGQEPYEMASTDADEMAAILFTSGSTGVPKGVIYRHGNFLAQVEAIRDVYGITPGEVDLPTFPLFGLFDPALGMSTVIPRMDATRPAAVDPLEIIDAVKAYGVTNMFGSPALLNTVGRYGDREGVKLPTLRRVISAGAPVAPSVMERVLRMLEEGAEVVTPYGATESLPVSSIGSGEVLGSLKDRIRDGAGVCVGRPLPNVELDVIQISDDPIASWDQLVPQPRGEVGEVVVRSPMVTTGYFNRPGSTASAKIPTPQGGVAHRMGDLGFMDDEGRLWFCGRTSQRVQTSAGVLFTVPCELVFNEHPAVYRSALVGVRRDGETAPVVCVELEAEARVKPDVLQSELRALAASQPHTASIETFLVHKGFPVDIRHNA
ncbi:MAG: fatty acid CoA ligase family protein, partial [Myxococcota bacterium]|nr:fatty acid CoA ligase family protein [Myxococcota bacterium]